MDEESPDRLKSLRFGAEVGRLAALSVDEYELARNDAAKRLNVRASFLDRAVAKLRGDEIDSAQGRPLELACPEPWHDPVDGAALLFELADYFSRHAFLPHRGSIALALWTVHTHAFEVFRHSPRLHIKAVAKNSGKTTVLDLLERVVCRPLATAHATSAVLFRAIEMAKPTLLMDEADTYLNDAEEVRGVLNAGHKRGGQVLRAVGDDFEPRAFRVFAPVAVAGIGSLPGTIADRAIAIPMKRATRRELPRPIDQDAEATAFRLARQAFRWASDHQAELAIAHPDMGALYNRAADNWRPLYAIADLAEDAWPGLARLATEALTVTDDDAETLGEKLLADIRAVFRADEITSDDLVCKLVDLEGRPWGEMPRTGRVMTKNTLARLLKPFGIAPSFVGPEAARLRGYRLARFSEAFERHLSPLCS